MIDIIFLTKCVKQRIALYTEFCLERIRRVIHARVDNLTAAAAGFQPESAVFLENKDIFISAGHFGGDRQSDYARADDDNIDFIGHKQTQNGLLVKV